MDYPYMIVVFLENFQAGDIIEPPKLVHITIKKKFKLVAMSEEKLMQILQTKTKAIGKVKLRLGSSKIYDDNAYMIIEVLDGEVWTGFHDTFATILERVAESRDPHFEGVNYYPHATWKVRNEVMFDPKPYLNTTHELSSFYLIKRIHPTESRVKILKELPLV